MEVQMFFNRVIGVGDPFCHTLAPLFNINKKKELRLYREWAKYHSLRPYIEITRNMKTYQITDVCISDNNKPAYLAEKKRLHLD